MHKIVIADTSCLIILTNIGELELLKSLYGKVIITLEIAIEYGEALPEWVIIENVQDKHKQKLLEMQIDKGESSAIALAMDSPGSLVIVDDFKARKVSELLRVPYTGTVGVIVKAKLNRIIPSIKPLLEKIKQTNFRVSLELEQQALFEANENG